jgi:putative membrane protein
MKIGYPDPGWRRLSPRMLLIHPVREVGRAIPALAGLLIAGSHGGHEWWSLLGLAIVVTASLLRWFTTRYLITGEQVQLRTGLVRRRTVTTAIDRVRTVDVTAHILHRLLGLARVAIGTGSSDRKRESLVLDGLSTEAAAALRAELLHRAAEPAFPQPARPAPADQEIARLAPSWIGYAPFTLSGVVTALAVTGLLWRIVSQAQLQVERTSIVRSVDRQWQRTPRWIDLLAGSAGVLIGITLLSMAGYLLAFWNFRLSRHPGGTLQVARGLITTRAVSIAEHRLRGVELSQLLPLRAVGGARLLAVATGLRVGRGAERGGTVLMPPCPAGQARRVAAEVLRDPLLLPVPLRRHPAAARRRRHLRCTGPAVLAELALLAGWLAGALAGWPAGAGLLLPVLAALLAEDRYAGLGHTLAGNQLITRYGALHRRQVLLRTDGIIGWNLRQSFFQRRAGLATLTATTAAGRQGYPVADLETGSALRLADAALPGLLADFLVLKDSSPNRGGDRG